MLVVTILFFFHFVELWNINTLNGWFCFTRWTLAGAFLFFSRWVKKKILKIPIGGWMNVLICGFQHDLWSLNWYLPEISWPLVQSIAFLEFFNLFNAWPAWKFPFNNFISKQPLWMFFSLYLTCTWHFLTMSINNWVNCSDDNVANNKKNGTNNDESWWIKKTCR